MDNDSDKNKKNTNTVIQSSNNISSGGENICFSLLMLPRTIHA